MHGARISRHPALHNTFGSKFRGVENDRLHSIGKWSICAISACMHFNTFHILCFFRWGQTGTCMLCSPHSLGSEESSTKRKKWSLNACCRQLKTISSMASSLIFINMICLENFGWDHKVVFFTAFYISNALKETIKLFILFYLSYYCSKRQKIHVPVLRVWSVDDPHPQEEVSVIMVWFKDYNIVPCYQIFISFLTQKDTLVSVPWLFMGPNQKLAKPQVDGKSDQQTIPGFW